jgi:hypothetical protein
MSDEAAVTEANWRDGTRTQIIEWWRGQGYTGAVSYTKKDMIPKVEEWLAAPPPAENTDADGNVTPITKPKKATRARKTAPAEETPSGEGDAAADA